LRLFCYKVKEVGVDFGYRDCFKKMVFARVVPVDRNSNKKPVDCVFGLSYTFRIIFCNDDFILDNLI
jgi:hypothetical protein